MNNSLSASSIGVAVRRSIPALAAQRLEPSGFQPHRRVDQIIVGRLKIVYEDQTIRERLFSAHPVAVCVSLKTPSPCSASLSTRARIGSGASALSDASELLPVLSRHPTVGDN